MADSMESTIHASQAMLPVRSSEQTINVALSSHLILILRPAAIIGLTRAILPSLAAFWVAAKAHPYSYIAWDVSFGSVETSLGDECETQHRRVQTDGHIQ